MNIAGKTVLITGGSAGIGLEATKQFVAAGAKVIITGRDQGKLDQAKKIYPTITAIKSDVADESDVRVLYKEVEALGGIDILYNNAGVTNTKYDLAKSSATHYQNAVTEMNVNYLGVIRMNDTFLSMLNERPESAIINTTSILSYVATSAAPTYAASKVAVRFYTESLRDHLQKAKSKIKVFEIAPPLVATSMAEGFDARTISPEALINKLISGIEKDKYTIKVGATKPLYWLSRLSPKIAFKLLNK